jgi:dienelactone hydrolase
VAGLFVQATTDDFYALPYPNDLRRNADGTLALDHHPSSGPLIDTYLSVFAAESGGFGTNSAVYFRFSGALDVSSFPASPDAARDEGASIYLVDIDPDSAHLGDRWPLRFRFEPKGGRYIGANWLAVLPYPGFPLRASTTYAVVVTKRVTAGGAPLATPPELAAILEGGGDAAAKAVYAPLLTYLDLAGGDERADVAHATVYTTSDPTGLMAKLREVVHGDVAAPVANVTVTDDANSAYTLKRGTYDSPNFQDGDPPYRPSGGRLIVDSTGRPVVQRTESLRFTLTIPKGVDMPDDGWPVVLYAHGTGGDYDSFVNDGTAGRMAAQGLAVIGIDQVLHGPRAPEGTDPDSSFVNLDNLVAARDNVRQSAADDFQLVRLVQGTDAIPGVSLDGSKVYFMGHSQGGLTGPPFLAYEPEVKGAVLSGAGGLIYFTLLYKKEPIDITGLVVLLLGESGNVLDEFHPMFALMQAFLEPSDPVNYGPLLMREPVAGVTAKDIFMSEGIVDHYTPPPNIEALGTSIGLQLINPTLQDIPGLALREIPVVDAPVSANVGTRTGVLLQYTAPPDRDGHFVIFRVPAAQTQHAEFLGTLARDGVATLVAP